jgi:hypothetical protein
MAVTVTEKFESRPTTIGRSSTIDLRYNVAGTDDDQAAWTALAAAAPAAYNGLVRESVAIEPVGPGLWDGTARYVPAGKVERNPPAVGETAVTFDTSGGSQHITQSITTVGRHGMSGDTAPDLGGAIGVTHDAVEGVDITVPVFNFTVTKVFASGSLPNPGTIFALTGKVNSGAFSVTDSRTGLTISLAAGECLFRGGQFSGQRGDGSAEFSYAFAGSPNRTNITIGSITVPSKKGWEYLWVRYVDTVDDGAKALVKKPRHAYVEKVYEDGDFSGLGIGG